MDKLEENNNDSPIMTIRAVIEGRPYMSNKEISEYLKISEATVCSRKNGIRKERKRYGDYAIISSGTNIYAFIDYDLWFKELSDKNMRKTVPAYDPIKVADACAYGTRIMTNEEWSVWKKVMKYDEYNDTDKKTKLNYKFNKGKYRYTVKAKAGQQKPNPQKQR